MKNAADAIFLITTFDAEGKENERLVRAESAHAARTHALRVNKASASDVARVMDTGAKIEDAKA